MALVHGRVRSQTPIVRIHSQCLTGDVLSSERCDCRAQLELSLRRIAASASGILLYLPQEGRGIGLMNKLRAYELPGHMAWTRWKPTKNLALPPDSQRLFVFRLPLARPARSAARPALLSNNPDKIQQLEKAGISCHRRVSRCL